MKLLLNSNIILFSPLAFAKLALMLFIDDEDTMVLVSEFWTVLARHIFFKVLIQVL